MNTRNKLWGALTLTLLLATSAYAAQPWSGYLGIRDPGRVMEPKYELPSWAHQHQERCVIKPYDYNNDGTYEHIVWGLEWTNPFTNKTICYVPRRGGGSSTSAGASSGSSEPETPPEEEPSCTTEEVCSSEEVCAEPVCRDVREKERVCSWKGVGHHRHYSCEWVWRTHEECDDPVCEDVESCSTVEVCAS